MVKIYKIKQHDSVRAKEQLLGKIVIIVLVLFAFWLIYLQSASLKKLDAKTEAYRVEIKSKKSKDGTMLYSPIYYYRVNGIEYVYASSISSNIGVKDIEKNKTIYYNSKNPSMAYPAHDKQLLRWVKLFLFAFFSVFIFVGISLKRQENSETYPQGKMNIRELQAKGTLYRNLPYQMVETNIIQNSKRLWKIQVEFHHPSGQVYTLTGSPRYDGKFFDEDGFVDLLIDLDNPNNYYLDFNIEEVDDWQ